MHVRGNMIMCHQNIRSDAETAQWERQFARSKGRDQLTRAAGTKTWLHLLHLLLFLIVITTPHSTSASMLNASRLMAQSQFVADSATGNSSALAYLQVTAPVLSLPECQQTLMVHSFGNSYRQPFVGEYHPPICAFNRVTINFTVTSAGRQFDRLAFMFFNDTEIFRTSTAEPNQQGIGWTYIKDMSAYLSLFKLPQKVIFDLGNIVNVNLTASYNTTLTATYFTADDDIEPADSIVPMSAHRSGSNMSSGFHLPGSEAMSSFQLPPNAKKAVFSVTACGQAAEEFWWGNVPSSVTNVFGNATTLLGHSPFRELQLFIDDQLAGVAWPYPVIFTGGVSPGLWRPIVGIDAFDLRDDEIDITPFIPLLSDGKSHQFTIKVLGIDDDGHGNAVLTENIELYWIVTGKVFIWTDPSIDRTTGTLPTISATPPSIQIRTEIGRAANDLKESLVYSVIVARTLEVTSTLNLASGPSNVYWKQTLEFSNNGTLRALGNDQTTSQNTAGVSSSSGYSRSFQYNLEMIASLGALAGSSLTIFSAQIAREKSVQQSGHLAFPTECETFDFKRLPQSYFPPTRGCSINNNQNGTAAYENAPNLEKIWGRSAIGQTYTVMAINDGTGAASNKPSAQQLYQRHVVASNGSYLLNQETFGEHGE